MNKLKSMLNSPKRIALFAVCVIVILALLAFAGIKVGASVLNNQGIGLEKATQVALQNAGYSKSEATLIRGHFDRDDGLDVYEIEFRAGGYDYDYVVSSKDGTIVSVDREMADGTLITDDNANGDASASQTADNNSGSQNSSNSSSSDHIGVEKAKTIALQSAGVNASSATFTKAKLDVDDGVYVYELEFVSGDYEYSYEIDATKGTVVGHEKESIYD